MAVQEGEAKDKAVEAKDKAVVGKGAAEWRMHGRRARRIREGAGGFKGQVASRITMREKRQRKLQEEELAKDEKQRAKYERMLAKVRAKRNANKRAKGDKTNVVAERQAIANAAMHRAALKNVVERNERTTAYLARGRAPPAEELGAWRQRFQERHDGRAPTEHDMQDMVAVLQDERQALRGARHEYAVAALAVHDAERALITKEIRLAKGRIKALGARNKEGLTFSAATWARESKQLSDLENQLRHHDRHQRAARDREEFWPNAHFRRNHEVRLALPGDEAAAKAQAQAEEAAAAEAEAVRYLERDVPFVDSSRVALHEITRSGLAGHLSGRSGTVSGRSASGSATGRSGSATGRSGSITGRSGTPTVRV